MAKKKDEAQIIDEVPKVQEAPAVIAESNEPGWRRVTHEELVAIEQQGKLVGYDPAKKLALVKP